MILLFVGSSVGVSVAQETSKLLQAEQQFTLVVLPILQRRCFACHGNDASDLEGELDISNRDGMLKGGESKTEAIVVGKSENSLLMEAIRWDGLEMPPIKRLT